MKILFISLGCDKNLVDTEVMLGLLASKGYEMTDDEQEADIIIVNTCCFINDAKEESINTILEMAELKKEGKVKGNKEDNITVVDLPGIYSLSPYTLEEVVARNYLIGERPDAIINIIDGTNIERNLYLSTQIMELGIPVVMAVNMMDLVKKSGDVINTDKLSKKLGCEVVEISALKGTGIMEAANKAIEIASKKEHQFMNLQQVLSQQLLLLKISLAQMSKKNRSDFLQ